ncbi:MAG: universal stress protein [Hyphomonadaceae bacterium]
MAYKDILAPVIALDQDEAALGIASELAGKFDARGVALIVSVAVGSAFEETPHALSEILEDVGRGARSGAGPAREQIIAWTERAQASFEVRDVSIEKAVMDDEILAHARVADLVVMTRGAPGDRARRAMIEDVLLKSGRPLMLAPQRPLRARNWEKIVIGWNATPQAVRAVSAAMPLLQAAKAVTVATVDARPSAAGHSQAPGHEIAAHLARHGVKVEVENIDGVGRSHGKALLDEAAAVGADLLVIGGYGHSRTEEAVFGGVTRELLAGAPIPLMLAH